LEDSFCRICGRPLNRPLMLWFDVSTVQLVPSTPTRLLEPVPAELPRNTDEVSMVSMPPAVASDEAVIREFAAEKGREFLADYQEIQESLPRGTEPSSLELLQEVVVGSPFVAGDSHKTFVLEKESITNRKGPTQSELDSSTKTGDYLAKTITKPQVAPGQLETRPEPASTSLTPKVEQLGKTQAIVSPRIPKPDLGPTSLSPKLEELVKTQASVRVKVPKTRHRSSSSLIGYSLGGVGGLSLVSAVVFTSTVLAFIGLGLTFWGALLLFIRPRHYVRSDLMDSTALSSLTTIDRVITSLGYTQKGVYIPVDNAEKAVVFIPAQPLKKIPNLDLVGKQTFLKDPEGIAMVPPGLALANLFERELKVKFSDWSLEKMVEQLPRLLIENLEMVQDCTIKIDGDKVNFTFVESVYSEFCNKLRSTTKVCSSLGCPMCSAMACVLAEVTHRPVEFDKDKYTTDGGTVESSYHLLPG
jgi:hypothetical protein